MVEDDDMAMPFISSITRFQSPGQGYLHADLRHSHGYSFPGVSSSLDSNIRSYLQE